MMNEPFSAAAAAATSAFNAGGRGLLWADINSQRIYSCAERLSSSAQSPQRDSFHLFFNQCISLSRGIDSSLATNNVPKEVTRLPRLIKQVCHRKNEFSLQAAIMVLMLSVKRACNSGWFSSKDAEDLVTLANEISSCFYPMGDVSTEPTTFLPAFAIIFSRFYPQLKLGQLLVTFEIKPGYSSYFEDFQISKDFVDSPHETLRLLIAQKDNADTSACIVNPPNVNFLINGNGVEKRTNVMMDLGPQLPTIINSYIKYGTNLLQVVGQSEGYYIVLVGIMSTVPSDELLAVQDYVQPEGTALDTDSEIIEGASTISLNCPISYTRIKTPVKGHMCRHHQCFDLSNYLEINSRRPSWRCPCCNQSVSYPDIRVDQNIVKILKEVEENALNVIISADGSWKTASRSKDKNDPLDGIRKPPSEVPGIQDDSGASIPTSVVYDLTEGDQEMETTDLLIQEDCKPETARQASSNIYVEMNHTTDNQFDNASSPMFFSPSVPANGTTRPVLQHITGVSQSSPAYIGPPSAPANLVARPVSRPISNIPQPFSANFSPQPVLTDAVSHASCRENEALGVTNPSSSPMLSYTPAGNGLHYQQSQFSQSMVRNEYGRSPAIPTNVTRIPTAIQALPVHIPGTSSSQHSSTLFGQETALAPSLPIQCPPLPASNVNSAGGIFAERQQHATQSYVSPVPTPGMAHSFLPQTLNSQSTGITVQVQTPNSATTQFPHSAAVQLPSSATATGLFPNSAAVQFPNSSYRVSSGIQNGHQQQSFNLRTPQRVSMPPHLRSSHFPQIQGQLGSSTVRASPTAGTHMQLLAAAHRAAQAPRPSPTLSSYSHALEAMSSPTVSSPSPTNTDRSRIVGATSAGAVQPVTRTENLIDLQSEQSWRPTGRMRGSLTGRAYSGALSQLMIQPTEQPPQASMSSSNLSIPPSSHGAQDPNQLSSI